MFSPLFLLLLAAVALLLLAERDESHLRTPFWILERIPGPIRDVRIARRKHGMLFLTRRSDGVFMVADGFRDGKYINGPRPCPPFSRPWLMAAR